MASKAIITEAAPTEGAAPAATGAAPTLAEALGRALERMPLATGAQQQPGTAAAAAAAALSVTVQGLGVPLGTPLDVLCGCCCGPDGYVHCVVRRDASAQGMPPQAAPADSSRGASAGETAGHQAGTGEQESSRGGAGVVSSAWGGGATDGAGERRGDNPAALQPPRQQEDEDGRPGPAGTGAGSSEESQKGAS